jgi:hypothetical protein
VVQNQPHYPRGGAAPTVPVERERESCVVAVRASKIRGAGSNGAAGIVFQMNRIAYLIEEGSMRQRWSRFVGSTKATHESHGRSGQKTANGIGSPFPPNT